MSAPGGFPDGFLWGAATSAYQIEGSPLADGAGMGVWHRFAHTRGNTREGQTGDVACDHYRRWEEDVAIMRALGLSAYRFGLSWPRILPEGRGRVNAAGIGFYDRLTDALLAAGIEPMVTLYHWDLPAALDDRGGWLNPDSASWFAEYAGHAFGALGDRVRWWATLNEPWVVMDAGYLFGVNAPGHRNLYEAPVAMHRQLLAHAEAVRLYRSLGARGRIGIVVNLEPKDPATASEADRAAAARDDVYNNRFHLDPVFFGRYPETLREIFGDAWPRGADEEAARIRESVDFVGVNYYTRRLVRHDPATVLGWSPAPPPAGSATMATGWEIHPAGLARALAELRARYGAVPVLITENGAAFPEPAAVAGEVLDDPLRVQCYRDHLLALRGEIARGADVRGYFAWSLLDNFEWSNGYSLRFGIVHVDFATQRRTLKESGRFYREVIRTRGAALDRPWPARA
ncbi:MAG TPA: GH1 family beta-glucosidase [Candidatus Eisenbacteria bacterium]|jgi:beta-glucosidase